MKTQFILYAEKKDLTIKIHPTDVNFVIVENISEKQGAELCKKFKASGSSCGRNQEHYKIGNFGKYN